MIWRIIKGLLSAAEINVQVKHGDILHITIKWRGHVIIEKVIDFIPGA